jgi:hypothetical protein
LGASPSRTWKREKLGISLPRFGIVGKSVIEEKYLLKGNKIDIF